MARKKMMEPERWITVDGNHLPVYPGGVIGQPGQEPPKEKTAKKNNAVNDKGTMSPKDLEKTESRRDALWDKEDKGTITASEKKELARLQKSISEHYTEKKNQTSSKTDYSTVADTMQQNVDALNDFHDKAWKYGADRDALKTLIRQRADEMPDGTVLARVNQETSSQYTSKDIMQQTETKMSKLYKINGQWSRYKDGSGKIDDIASEVIHGSGKLQTLESAKQQAAKLQETDEIKTRGYGTKERFTSTKDNDTKPATTSRNAKYDTSRSTKSTKSTNLNAMDITELRALAKEYGVSQKVISMYDTDELRMLLTGMFRKK